MLGNCTITNCTKPCKYILKYVKDILPNLARFSPCFFVKAYLSKECFSSL